MASRRRRRLFLRKTVYVAAAAHFYIMWTSEKFRPSHLFLAVVPRREVKLFVYKNSHIRGVVASMHQHLQHGH
jgi:hypothetical protein